MSDPWVLVVDDDDDIRETISLVLASHGHHTVGARDGLEALQKLDGDGMPCLILLDLRMPRMNGIEFLRALRAQPQHARIPVVVLTGDSTAAGQASATGANACLTKPIDLHTLLDSVERFAC